MVAGYTSKIHQAADSEHLSMNMYDPSKCGNHFERRSDIALHDEPKADHTAAEMQKREWGAEPTPDKQYWRTLVLWWAAHYIYVEAGIISMHYHSSYPIQ